MTAKIILGKRPETFAPFDVRFKGPDGREHTIPAVVFRYRSRREFAEMVDGRKEGAAYKPAEGEAFSLAKLFEATDAAGAELLLDSIKEWGLDVPVDRDTIEQLVDELPAAWAALWEAYGNAARDGRLGN